MTYVAALQQAVILLIGLATLSFFVAGIAFLTHGVIVARDAVTRRVDSIRIHSPKASSSIVARFARPAVPLSWIGRGGLNAREAREVVRYLGKLGIPAEHAAATFFALRVALMVLVGMAMGLLVSGSPVAAFWRRPVALGLMTGVAAWFMPYVWIRLAAARRIQEIEAGLPEALELLVVSVEAGLALEDGIERIVVELAASQPALAEELAITSADLKILPSRDLALANLAKRVDVPSVRSVVTTLSQTMRYGTPLVQALRVVAAELRNDALVKLEEQANRLPTLLTVPMMVFILPTIFLIVGGPAVLRLIDIITR
jgi:tight adherence protein C